VLTFLLTPLLGECNGKKGAIVVDLIFLLLENFWKTFLVSDNFCPKMQNLQPNSLFGWGI